MTSIVDTLFGVSPERIQQERDAAANTQALAFARLSPIEQASYGVSRGAYGLAGALGGMLGGQDPELQRATQRQQILGMIDPNQPDSFEQAAQMALQGGDQQLAFGLRMEADKFKQQAQERQINTLRTEDYLTQRGQKMQTAGMNVLANDLMGQIRNPDGTLNQQVVDKLKSFPQGMAAITAQAKILPDLRRLGAPATPEVDPFAPFVTDTTIPQNVQTYAKQLSKSYSSGSLDPEKIDVKVKELSDMTQRAQQFEQAQQQIKDNQASLLVLRQQGLENSRQGLLIQQGNQLLAQQNAKFQQDMKKAEPSLQPLVAVVDPVTGKQVLVSRGEALSGRMTPAAAMESLSPKEIQKREAALPQATSSIKGFETKSAAFIKDLEMLRDSPGLDSITGIAAGRLPGITPSGRAAEALYNKITAKGGFQALQDMRDASKTGGALGNVSNQEGKQLTASFAAIDRRQDSVNVKAALNQAIADIQGSQTRMREAYDATYSYKSDGVPAASKVKPAGVDASNPLLK